MSNVEQTPRPPRNTMDGGIVYRLLGILNELLQDLTELSEVPSDKYVKYVSNVYNNTLSRLNTEVPERLKPEVKILLGDPNADTDLLTLKARVAAAAGWLNGFIASVTVFSPSMGSPAIKDVAGIIEEANVRGKSRPSHGQYL